MCVKLPFRDLNLDPYLPYSISTYTCGMAITLRVCGDRYKTYIKSLFGTFPNYFICELNKYGLYIFKASSINYEH